MGTEMSPFVLIAPNLLSLPTMKQTFPFFKNFLMLVNWGVTIVSPLRLTMPNSLSLPITWKESLGERMDLMDLNFLEYASRILEGLITCSFPSSPVFEMKFQFLSEMKPGHHKCF